MSTRSIRITGTGCKQRSMQSSLRGVSLEKQLNVHVPPRKVLRQTTLIII